MIDIDDEHLEFINFLMKVLIIASTIFFVLAFIVYFFGLFGIQQLTSEETLFHLSPVIVLLLIFSVIFNLTRYRCPECHTFISRHKPCPVCLAIKENRIKDRQPSSEEESSFLEEEQGKQGVEEEIPQNKTIDE